MTNNWDLIERNEAGSKAQGGTELFMKFLYNDEGLPRDLLENFQIIPGRVRDLKEDKIRVLTLHDNPTDPECEKLREAEYRDKFHQLVFISNWQYQQFQTVLGLPYSVKSCVIENGLKASPVDVVQKYNNATPFDKINLVYSSTPQRGLGLLLAVFEELAKRNPDIHLHVFSSFKIYGWDDADKQFEPLYDFCRKHPQITYHGFETNDKLLDFLPECHIHAYPCTWPETACRSVLEAMSAGMLCVHPNFSALPDTTGSLNMMYNGDHTDQQLHANLFANTLQQAIEAIRSKNEMVTSRLLSNKYYVDNRYNVTKVKLQWEYMLKDLLNKYKDPASRVVQERTFRYRTVQQ